MNLLDVMRAARVSRLIFSSTAAVYGQPEEVPVEKTFPTRPTNLEDPYGSSKLAADAMIGYEAAAGPAGSTTRTPRS